LGPVVIASQVLQCNDDSVTTPLNSPLQITGTSSTNGISISKSRVDVVFSDLSIQGGNPFIISDSSVSLSFQGSNTISSRSAERAGIECSSWSNISISTLPDAILSVDGGYLAAGIGTGRNGSCDSLPIRNGSFIVSGGTAIGSGHGLSTVLNLTITDGNISARGSYSGSGIGSGFSSSGETSKVKNLTSLHAIISVRGFPHGTVYGSSYITFRSFHR
jgi:hypothetical protein